MSEPRVTWTVQAVFDNATGMRFAYTVGLTEYGLPELLVIGRTHPMTLGSMLNYVALQSVRLAYPLSGPVDVGLELKTGGDLRAAVREVTNLARVKREYATHAAAQYPNMRAQQLVYADPQNLLPGEPGYSSEPINEQPLV